MSDETTTQQRTPDEIRSDIEHTREELADTAAALAHKADVKGRAKERVEEIKGNIKETASRKTPDSVGGATESVTTTVKQNPLPTAAIAAAVFGFAIGYLLAKRANHPR